MQFVTIFGYIKPKPIGVKDVQDTFLCRILWSLFYVRTKIPVEVSVFLLLGKVQFLAPFLQYGILCPRLTKWHPADS